MTQAKQFTGSFVALITPMFANGEVDYDSLSNLLEWHIESGTDGLVILGTTAESATLTSNEKLKVVTHSIDVVKGRLPIVVGNGSNSTAEAIEITQQFDHLAIDGFLTVTPYYNKPTQRGMFQHFKAISESTEKPIILYNVPGRTAVDLHNDTILELMALENIVGLKDATGDLTRVASLKAANPDFVLLSGDDASARDYLRLGGDGFISVTGNIRPAMMKELVTLSQQGEYQAAIELDKKLESLHHDLFVEPNPVPAKWALYEEGRIASDFVRLPLITMEPIHHETIKHALNKAN